MKKFFLFSLLTLMCSVMAWGSEITVSNFAELKTQLSASGTADVVKLANDIEYPNTTDLLDIQRSLTLDGQGYKITGYHANLSLATLGDDAGQGTSQQNHAIMTINNSQDANKHLEVAIKNCYFEYSAAAKSNRIVSVAVFDGVDSLSYENVHINSKGYSTNATGVKTKNNMWAFFITGKQNTLKLNVANSDFVSSSYCSYIMKPIKATFTNTTISGYCALYLKHKYQNYGNTMGTRGSVITCDACTFNCPNGSYSEGDNFAIFPMEDDGITLNLHNCSYNTEEVGSAYQRIVNLQYYNANTKTGSHTDFQDVHINISGDNTHIYNTIANRVAFNGWVMGQLDPSAATYKEQNSADNKVPSDLYITVTGGTFSFNPEEAHWAKYGDGKVYDVSFTDNTSPYRYGIVADGQGAITIAEGYEVSEVKQGEATLYRVVKKAAEKEPGVMYDLNDKVAGEGIANGDNPVSSFDLSTGTDMTLNQETTTAGYVQISDNATEGATTVTVAKKDADIEHSQTLVINNGLDVQGNSAVVVEPTAALVIGEGGITTEKPENIVIEADEDGAASLLLHPEITVNQTPELTVKMTAKQIGKVGADYFWHRFAMPVDAISSLPKEPGVTTKIFGWDYENEDWKSLSTLSDLKPFYGYTLTTTADRQDVTYTFQGHLVGNLNETLNFTDEGYNFFGNSYTGYIDIVALADQLLDHADIDGAVWVWNTDEQSYHVVTLAALRDYPSLYEKWQKEIAPMQTFILRLATPGVKSASTVVDYKSAIWDNPRYGNGGGAGAPARKNAFEGNAIRMTVAANGMKDEVLFIEKANFSDEFDKGYDGTKFMNNEAINIYSTVNNENYSAVATDQIEGKMLTIETVNEVNYTISFDVVMGETEYALRDNATNKVIAIEEGASYEFAAQPNSTVEGRFEIVDRANVVTSIDNAQDNKANVKGIYTIMGQYVGENFDVLPTGVYVVDGVKIVK